jgi:hypothetical protein
MKNLIYPSIQPRSGSRGFNPPYGKTPEAFFRSSRKTAPVRLHVRDSTTFKKMIEVHKDFNNYGDIQKVHRLMHEKNLWHTVSL